MDDVIIVTAPVILSILLTYFMNRNLQNRLIIENQNFEEKMKNREIDANLIAKSRIEWIQEVRKIMSEYLIKSQYLLFLYEGMSKQRIKEIKQQEKKEDFMIFSDYYNNKVKEANELQIETTQLYFLLELYFSDNEGNEKILQDIKNVKQSIGKTISILKSNNLVKNDDDSISQLVKTAKDYFKEEWEVAKEKK